MDKQFAAALQMKFDVSNTDSSQLAQLTLPSQKWVGHKSATFTQPRANQCETCRLEITRALSSWRMEGTGTLILRVSRLTEAAFGQR